MTLQELLEAIAKLPEPERRDLLSRLREIYETKPPAPQPSLERGDWEREADFMIVFDGGSQGNPGPAYGSYVIYNNRGAGSVERLKFDEPLTNNEAEYQTLLAALRALRQRLGKRAGQTVLVVRGDSQLVIEQVAGNWKAKDERMRQLSDEARRLLSEFKRYRLVWQPRQDTLAMLGH